MSARLIALTGPAGSGKTTVALELVRRGFVRVRFAGPLKAMLRTLGLTEAQVDGDEKSKPCDLLCGKTPRHAMQTLGDQWGRTWIGPDLWVNATMCTVDALLEADRDVVIDDCRYANEAQAIVDRYGGIYSLVRDGAGIDSTHASEKPIAEYYITRFIPNNKRPLDTAIYVLNADKTDL